MVIPSFDWLNAVFATYQQLFKLPVKNYPYYLIDDKTEERLIAKTAAIQATWDRTANTIILSADKAVILSVTGVSDGELYGGQNIREIGVNSTPIAYPAYRALDQ